MAGTRKKPTNGRRKPKPETLVPELVQEDGYWWIVSGTKRLNVGRNKNYAQRLLDEGVGA